jgi:hypothetical protein
VDWGDGKSETFTLSGFTSVSHAYSASSGSYTVTLTGDTITYLDCNDNQLTALDVSKNTALRELHCNANQLTALDVSKNTALTGLDCSNNQLTALDVSKNTALTGLDCSNNQLTALDVSKNTALQSLNCNNNQLTALNVSKNTALMHLDCRDNQLDAGALNALFETLHGITHGGSEKYIYISGNPGAGSCNKSLAEGKGWRVN